MKKETAQFNFAKAFEELEAIAKEFETESLDIDQGIKKFERGLELAKRLKAKLQEAENKISTIKRRFESEEDSPKDSSE